MLRTRVTSGVPIELRTVTTKDGEFAFDRVQPGRYILVAIAPATSVGTTAGPMSGVSRPFASADVAVVGDDIVGLELNLTDPPLALGRVISSDPQFNAFKDVRLRVRSIDSNPSSLLASLVPEFDGTLKVPALPPGRYAVSGLLLPPQDSAFIVSSIRAGDTNLLDSPVEVPANAPPFAMITVTVSNHISELSGSVKDVQGSLVKDMFVAVVSQDESSWFEDSPQVRLPSRAPNSASFVFKGLLPGAYVVVATPQWDFSRWPSRSTLRGLATSGTKIQISEGQRLIQALIIGGES